ncbi:MAG TPA: hypothetical protein VGR35_04395 [Tepidisphaeraceae bacterium]|nr:hypothetical protein [Tepidisphaeraceae bacterium]
MWPATADALSKVDSAKYDIKLIDADQNKQAVHDLGVQIIPTVIVYRGREGSHAAAQHDVARSAPVTDNPPMHRTGPAV